MKGTTCGSQPHGCGMGGSPGIEVIRVWSLHEDGAGCDERKGISLPLHPCCTSHHGDHSSDQQTQWHLGGLNPPWAPQS